MATKKSTVEEIRNRFDNETERYANLETGQVGVMDAPLTLSLIAEAAAASTPHAQSMLDVGCGGGNYSLKLLERLPNLNVTLVDLSQVMLGVATERVRPKVRGSFETINSDIRELDLGTNRFDIIVASAVLHHLRTDEEWRSVFQKLHDALRPRGSFWIFDIIESPLPELEAIHWRRYEEYLMATCDEKFAKDLIARIIEEDTPRSVPYQLELLKSVGFSEVELLHKNSCFAAFGAMKR